MKWYYMVIPIIIFLFLIAGCPSQSDYAIGYYDVLTTVKTSTCPEDRSIYPENMIFPTGFSSGQVAAASWNLERIGITGNGTDQVNLSIETSNPSNKVLNIVGTLDNGVIRIELQLDIVDTSFTLYRSIYLQGSIEADQFTGEIRTILSNTSNSPTKPPFIPASSPCEVHEEFLGQRRPSDT